MAISYVGGKGAGTAGQGGGSISLTTGLTGGSGGAPIEGDLVVVTVSVGTAARAPTIAISTPSGYTALTAQRTTATTYDTNVQTCYKVMGSTPDTAVTIPASGNNADGIAYTIQVFRGVDPTTPMDATPTYATGSGTNSNPNPAAITPVTAGAWIVCCGGGAAAAGAVYTAGYLTNLLTYNGPDTNDGSVGSGYYTGWTSGAYDPAAFGGGNANAANSWGATTLALRPLSLSAVGQDSSGAYDILTSAGADSAGSYAISAGVGADFPGSYAVFTTVGADAAGSYDITVAVGADAGGAYSIAAAVGADLLGAYGLGGMVGSDMTGVYGVAGTVGADHTGSYSVLGAVGADFAGTAQVLAAVGANLVGAHAVLAMVGQSLAGGYGLAGAVSADLVGAFGIGGVVAADLPGGYDVLAPVGAELAGAYALAEAVGYVGADLAGGYVLWAVVSTDLPGAYLIDSLLRRAPAGGGQIRAGAAMQRLTQNNTTRAPSGSAGQARAPATPTTRASTHHDPQTHRRPAR